MNNLLRALASLLISFNLYSSDLLQPADTKNNFISYLPHLLIPQFSSESFYSKRMFSVSVSESNTIFDPVYFKNNGKNAVIDVETSCMSLFYFEKIIYDIELSASISLIRHWSGFLDSPIENFHSLPIFGKGLPNGGRENVARNKIDIQYENKGKTLSLTKSRLGLSDPSFFIKKSFIADQSGVYFSTAVKPSIGSKDFINSNTFDLGLSAGADFRKEKMYLFTSAAFVKFFGSGSLDDELEQSKKYITSFCIGGGYAISENTAVVIQLYVHTSILDTGVKRLDYPTVCNTYAFRWRYGKSSVLQFDITEDTFTYAGADISFNIKNETRF